MDAKIEHLKIIQAIVGRLTGYSFLLKGWTVTLIAALFVLADKTSSPKYFALGFFPLLVFWMLDAYYVAKEREFRDLYEEVRGKLEAEIDFSLELKASCLDWPQALVASVDWPFYVTIATIVLVVVLAHG